MRAGRLKEVVFFDRPDDDLGTWNESRTKFVEAFEERAGIEPLRGNEHLVAQQINSELTTRIVTRWSPRLEEVTAKWRIRCRNPHTGEMTAYTIGQPPLHTMLGQREIIFTCHSGVKAT